MVGFPHGVQPAPGPAQRLAWRTGYEADEVALGIALAIALHLLPLTALVVKAALPSSPDDPEEALVAKPVIAATMLKLGKPLDPSRLPDRLVPARRTAPRKQVLASRENPRNPDDDAGAPPPDTEDSDLLNLVARSDPFAEDGGLAFEEGHPDGVLGGTETDPTKVRAGDLYAAKLAAFFHQRWKYPTVISQGEANKLCVVFQININPQMVIWHVRHEAIKPSGNDLFDDSARGMLQKLLDDHAPLPAPPAEVEGLYRGRTVNLLLSGDMHGDTSRCK